ncbi:MAG: toll/interleukin-1 receptor domain-containing protein [Myxococcaceae bacterium]|nr:toll/interleukin-1 receptor domain-containing protein [Myxococcaceae bacterium]
MESTTQRVFISYSWDSEEHKEWVLELATRLRSSGVDAILDRWNIHPGEELSAFMEGAIRESNFVVLICTPRYKAKADKRQGGVGYEGGVITGEVMAGVPRRKFIPVLREGSWPEAAPSWCAAALMIDLRGDPSDPKGFEELLRSLLGARPGPPPLGTSPFARQGQSSASQASPQTIPAASTPDDKAAEWTTIKRLISQNRPIARQEGLNRWNALSASKHGTPSDVIDAAANIVADTTTTDEDAYKLLIQITTSDTPDSHRAITRLTYALARGAFARRSKTELHLSYSATTVPDAREQLFQWLEQAQSERDVESGLSALFYMSQTFSPDLEQLFDRIEHICQRYPTNTYAQRTFKNITGKDLSDAPLSPSLLGSESPPPEPTPQALPPLPKGASNWATSLNVPKKFNLNAARYHASTKHTPSNKNQEIRQRILSTCYEHYMKSPSIWVDVLHGVPEEDCESVVREIEWLAHHKYIKASVSADHTIANVQLTPAGRDFFEQANT